MRRVVEDCSLRRRIHGLFNPVYVWYIHSMRPKDPLAACTGFDWDENNAIKNWELHRVTPEESEDVFFHDPFVIRSDAKHSKSEKRYWALGRTGKDRKLFLAFTVRRKLIRIISARDMSRRELEEYERHEKGDS
jgi:uncharacterized protein